MATKTYTPRPGSKASIVWANLESGPITCWKAAELMGCERRNVMPIMAESRKAGLIERRAGSDGEAWLVRTDRPIPDWLSPASPRQRRASKQEAKPEVRPSVRRAVAVRPAEPEPEPEPEATDEPAVAFGLFSDGDLILARGEESFHLPRAQTAALLNYLQAQQALISTLFARGGA